MKTALNVFLWALVVWIFTRFHLPGNSLFLNSLQNSGHGIVFFVLTIFALMTFGTSSRLTAATPIVVPIVIFFIGLSVEALQHLTGRGASASDLIMNGAGITAAFILFRLTHKKTISLLSIFWAMFAFSLLAWCIHKPLRYLAAELGGKPLPILNDFDSTGAGFKIRVGDADMAIADHSSVWISNHSRSMKVDFRPGIWPSVAFQEPHSCWCEYDQLSFDVLNLDEGSIRLNIRVDDPTIDFPDHSFMTVSRMLEYGAVEIIIPLAELAHDARNRGEPKFKEITKFVLYLPDNQRLKTLYFDNFQLVKKTTDEKRECAS